MSMTTVIIFSVLTGTKCFIICVANAFTIFVFWNYCFGSLWRACYLMLNLAVVDLLVGVVGPIAFVTRSIPSLLETLLWWNERSLLLFNIFCQSFLLPSLHLNRLFTKPQAVDFPSTVSLLLVTWSAGITVTFLYILSGKVYEFNLDLRYDIVPLSLLPRLLGYQLLECRV